MKRIAFAMFVSTCAAHAQGRLTQYRTFNSPIPGLSGAYGSNILGLGDLDGDGFADYAVSAPAAAVPLGGPSPGGVIYVYSGRQSTLLFTIEGDQLSADFGAAMLSIGDVNNDGTPDLAVGSPSQDTSFGNAGRVRMFSGLDGQQLWVSEGENQGDKRGTCLAPTPDLTGDGVPDLITGEPSYSLTGVNRGRVVYLNGATGAAFGYAEGPVASASFGRTATGTVTSMAAFVGDSGGRTYAMPAPILGAAVPVLFRDKPPGGHVAAQLALIPKRGGGHRVAIGLATARNNGTLHGALWLHELNGFEVFERLGAQPVTSFGGMIARGHDLDGDGEDEILATHGNGGFNPASVEVVRQNGTLQDELSTGCASAPNVDSLPDVTGDGRGEFLLSYASGLCGTTQAWVFADGLSVALSTNGAGDVTATSTVDFGAGRPGEPYWQFYSISGTEPGFIGPSPWPLVPLNFDGMTTTVAQLGGTPIAPNSMGNLDVNGRVTTQLNVPSAIAQIVSGITFQSCVLVFDQGGLPVVATSNPVEWVMP